MSHEYEGAFVRRSQAAAIAFGILTIALGWWLFFWPPNPLGSAAEVLNSHPEQFDRILAILRANPRLCFVSLNRPIDVHCPSARSPEDPRDYSSVAALMREVRIDNLNPYRRDETGKLINGTSYRQSETGELIFETGETGELIYMEFSVFRGSMIPWRQPITGVWYDRTNVMKRSGCIQSTRPNWYVCPSRMVLFP